jgi:type I restriction enzyme R subunit
MISEALLETWTLTLLREVGYTVVTGADLGPEGAHAERTDYTEVMLAGRLRAALAKLNPNLPADALNDAFQHVVHPELPALVTNNRALHRMLVDGVRVEYQRPDGTTAGERARLIDYDNPGANDWLVVNQFIVRSNGQLRRPDVVVFVNGLPLAVIELKNPTDAEATTYEAFHQLQTYKEQIPDLFAYNAVLVVSDGVDARIGALTSSFERFLPWRTIEGETTAPTSMPQLQVLILGVFEQQRFLDLLRYFIVFEDNGGGHLEKKIAAYHQFHAVNRAVESTLAATSVAGSRQCGVVWHTQGSGKSLTMVFYAGRLVNHPALENPTIVVLTDRNDLDDQLFGVFARCHDLLRQQPIQASDRDHLRTLLSVASGGVIFTTIQKFLPPDDPRDTALSLRRNIVVIADEAHRSQYGFDAKLDLKTGELSYGFAQRVRDALPHASFLGFTGTPVELTDRNTRQVFGDYISIYDIEQAVRDGATVPIYYENRIAKLDIDERERLQLDHNFEEVTEGEEIERKEALKSKWTALEAIVGAEKRLTLIAENLITHFEQRQEILNGKGMIVCMSRRVCIDLYRQLLKLRPTWHSEDDKQGLLKIIMTGSSTDPQDWQPHIRTKARREALAQRFRDPTTSFKLVIVRDMWLTGFDAPCLHTMYVDKPMRGHGLMQAIARVNRVFRDKPGGLIVDYLGLTDQLQQALNDYTQSGGVGEPTANQQAAIEAMQSKYEICSSLFYGFDWSAWTSDNPGERLSLLPAAQEHIFDQEDGMARLNQAVKDLSQAHALAMPAPEALVIRDDVAFFQSVRIAITKTTASGQSVSDERLNQAVRQLVSRAIAPEKVIDVFAVAGLAKPDISILSDEFLDEVRRMPQKRLAVELLRKLLRDELNMRARTNLVQSRSFADMLERSIRAYQHRAIETVQVIEELIELARDLRAAEQRGEALGLSEAELAFYEALEVNDSAVYVLGDETLKSIARELTAAIRRNIAIDWTVRESVRARMRALVKRILRKYGYPPDKQEKATQTVLEQAELLSETLTGH